jgi:isopenicillin-N N-acyltransferase-like protein
MIVGHAGGIAIDFECAPDETFQVHPENGLLVHANHFVSPVALAKLKDTGIAETPDSLYRDLRVRQLLAPKAGALTVADVKSALLDDFETPWSVCRPVRANLQGVETATVATLVMRPADGTMEVAMMPATGAAFATYALAEEGARSAAE